MIYRQYTYNNFHQFQCAKYESWKFYMWYIAIENKIMRSIETHDCNLYSMYIVHIFATQFATGRKKQAHTHTPKCVNNRPKMTGNTISWQNEIGLEQHYCGQLLTDGISYGISRIEVEQLIDK